SGSMGDAVTCRGLDATPDALLRDLAAAGFEIAPPGRTTTTVLDTFDGRFHDDDLRLEHRDRSLVLSGPTTSRAAVAADVLPRFATDLPPGPFRSRVAAIVDVRAVLPVATVVATTRRAERRNREGKVVAVVTVHEAVDASGTSVEGWWASVEELTGYVRQ